MVGKNNNQDIFVNPKDKELFIKTLNKRGFLLEYKVCDRLLDMHKDTEKFVGGYNNLTSIDKNKKLDYQGEPCEIDVLFSKKPYFGIVECKKTDFDWIFAREKNEKKYIHLLKDTDKGFCLDSAEIHSFPIVRSDIAMMFDPERNLELSNKCVVKTSYKEINEYIHQVLRQTKIFMIHDRHINQYIIPIIVTNAKIWVIEFDEKNIDANGDLKNYDVKKLENGLVYNIPEIFNITTVQIDKSLFLEPRKSVFITTVDNLKDFINTLDGIVYK